MSILEKDGRKIAAALFAASAVTSGAAIYAVTAGQNLTDDVTAKAIDTTDFSAEMEAGTYIEEAPAQPAEEEQPQDAPEAEVPVQEEAAPAEEAAVVQEAVIEELAAAEQAYVEAPVVYEEAPVVYEQAPVVYEEAPVVYEETPAVYEQLAAPVEQAPAEVIVPEVPVEQTIQEDLTYNMSAPAEAPAEVLPPVEAPVEVPAEELPPVEAPAQAPVEVLPPVVEAPVEAPVEELPPVEAPVEAPAEVLPPQDMPVDDYSQAVADDYSDLNARIADAALGLVGTTDGWQCTEVVQQALANAGVSDAQNLWPNEYCDVYGYYTDTPQAGNLIYYNQGGNGLDHIAVYIGDGQAVHGNYSIDGTSYTVVAGAELPGCTDYAYIQVCR